ncbi:hypothetical protein [Streptomyces noursei]|uniref:Uncharacterized protein n=1 Tax=Streptomyces noursei TaxID=1971 RepID=A0A2N8PQZ7_STRNR|nr:hypothetical protein [Streptomyces noursei]PNE43427.1 hypothetical protein AOB60_00345 [Streptomyces noursei]
MSTITIEGKRLHRLLQDNSHPHETFQRAYEKISDSHRGCPEAEIVPRLRQAADAARLGSCFSTAEFRDQAAAISSGSPYRICIVVT